MLKCNKIRAVIFAQWKKNSNVRSHHPGCSNNATSLISTDFCEFSGIGFFGVICHDHVHDLVHRDVPGPDHGLLSEVLPPEMQRVLLERALPQLELVLPQLELVQLAQPVFLRQSQQEFQRVARMGS